MTDKIHKTDAEWREEPTPEQYACCARRRPSALHRQVRPRKDGGRLSLCRLRAGAVFVRY